MELVYRIDSRHVLGEDEVRRSETWRYLVRSVSDGDVYEIEGRLSALTASITHAGHPMPKNQMDAAVRSERARLAAEPVTLSLSMDGRIDSLKAETWADALPHRLLALRLPLEPVGVGERWNDASDSRPLGDLVPTDQKLEFNGTQQFESLRWADASRGRSDEIEFPGALKGSGAGSAWLEATLRSSAAVLPKNGDIPSLDIEGNSLWHLDLGLMLSRRLVIRERGGAATGLAGSMELSLQLVDYEP
jgi:hypothetical protein